MTDHDCDRTRARFDLWLDGATSSAEAAAISDHLVACALCAAALADDVRLGASVEDALKLQPAATAPEGTARGPWIRRAAAAAAVLLMATASYVAGRSSGSGGGDDGPRGGGGGGGGRRDVDGTFDPDWRLAEFGTGDMGVFAPATVVAAEVLGAERDFYAARLVALQTEHARSLLELDVRRADDGAPVDPGAVVRRFKAHVREAAAAGGDERSSELRRRLRAAYRLLAVDRDGSTAAITAWLDEAADAEERRAAVRLLALVRGAGAIERLVREARSGPAQDAALDGLLRACDERCKPLFAEIAARPGAPVDLRVKALGGLHRLGEAGAAERLVGVFRSEADAEMRRRIVYHLAVRPTAFVVGELPQLVEAAAMDARERRLFADVVGAVGGEASRVIVERLGF